MTLNLTELLARVREFIARGGVADERVDSLILRGPLADAAAQAVWLDLAAASLTAVLKIQIHDPSIGGDLDAADAFDATRHLVLTVIKPQFSGIACFFFQDQLARYFREPAVAAEVLVSDVDAQAAFTARGLYVGAWDLAATLAPRDAITPIDPTPFVRDFVPGQEIPTDLSPWILITPPAATSVAFRNWKTVASRRLFGSLVSSAWSDDEGIWLQASGPPLYRMRADSAEIEPAFEALTQSVNWVFLSGQDVEARHIIFASELARADRNDQTFTQTLTRALDSAKATYEAHVQSSSRETLKALSELRKTVIDETQKVTQKSQELTAGLWRDLAVTAAPFVLKILGDTGKVSSPFVAAGFYFAAALFIAISFVLQWRINATFFKSQTDSRATWMHTLYYYISVRERQEIADAPVENALRSYRETRAILLLLYIALIVVLIAFGVRTLNQTNIPPRDSFQLVTTPVGSTPAGHKAKSAKPVPPCVPSAKETCPSP